MDTFIIHTKELEKNNKSHSTSKTQKPQRFVFNVRFRLNRLKRYPEYILSQESMCSKFVIEK